MDCFENKSSEEMTIIIKTIEKYLVTNDYESAFMMFLLHSGRVNFLDRDELTIYFYKYLIEKNNLKNNTKGEKV
jgi:hypothetical protein